MADDLSSRAQVIVAAIGGFATLGVAWITTRRGKRVAEGEPAFEPKEHGEHAHTRDIVRSEIAGLHRRFDLLEHVAGLVRQQTQVGLSKSRVDGEPVEKL